MSATIASITQKSGIEKGNENDVGFDVDSEGLKHTQELSDR